MSKRVTVCILNTCHNGFDYVCDGLKPVIGARVWVPFRNRIRLGLVVGFESTDIPASKLKSIDSIIDEKPLLSAEMLALCHWMSRYYYASLSEVIGQALPKSYRQGDCSKLAKRVYYQLTMSPEQAYQQVKKQSSRQRLLIDFLARKAEPVSKKQIVEAGFHVCLLNALLKTDILCVLEQEDLPEKSTAILEQPLLLNKEQHIAVETISERLSSYHAFLLYGVTGSGKTEVYLQTIARVLALGRQVLVLVPEIGLTPQLLNRFTARFSEPMVVIHSDLNDTQRKQAWQLACDDKVKLVIGTRSAIFTPMPALGLIIIDEEHDASLKQMDGVRYHARDTALMRAYTKHIPIILGSATPSLESLHNCELKKYTLLRLQQKAINSVPLHYSVVDLRNQRLQQGFASTTLNTIRNHLSQNNQVLVFINRRGFAPILFCHQCGWMADCRACDSHLTFHRATHYLLCHHCGHRQNVPDHCPDCNGKEVLPVGVGTQRAYDFLSQQFPDSMCVRIDRDEIQKKRVLEQRLEQIKQGHATLIVGTQMLAKGHHFPRLTLVVVLEADNGLYNQDFRALENLGQLLTQVAGRAGRAQFPGQVLIQTHVPQHPIFNTLIQQGFDCFAKNLLALRQQAALPPYHFLAVLRVQGRNESVLLQFLCDVKQRLDNALAMILGPAPAPLARKANYHRMQLLINAASRQNRHIVLTQLHNWLTMNKQNRNVRWSIDVDPMDLS